MFARSATFTVALLIAVAAFAQTVPTTKPADFESIRKAGESLHPTASSPYYIDAADAVRRAKWKDVVDQYMDLPVDQVTAHPSSADFPGEVPASAPRVHRDFSFPAYLPRWHSTGTYAAPAEKLTITVSPADLSRHMFVIIGCHTDNISRRDAWPRFPKISRRFEITKTTTVVANAFGGLVYIGWPRDPALGGNQVVTFGGYGWLNEQPEKVPEM